MLIVWIDKSIVNQKFPIGPWTIEYENLQQAIHPFKQSLQ